MRDGAASAYFDTNMDPAALEPYEATVEMEERLEAAMTEEDY